MPPVLHSVVAHPTRVQPSSSCQHCAMRGGPCATGSRNGHKLAHPGVRGAHVFDTCTLAARFSILLTLHVCAFSGNCALAGRFLLNDPGLKELFSADYCVTELGGASIPDVKMRPTLAFFQSTAEKGDCAHFAAHTRHVDSQECHPSHVHRKHHLL